MIYDKKIKRKQAKSNKKKVQKAFKSLVTEISKVPTKCVICEEKFDTKSNYHLDNWKVQVSDVGIKMTCDKCFNV